MHAGNGFLLPSEAIVEEVCLSTCFIFLVGAGCFIVFGFLIGSLRWDYRFWSSLCVYERWRNADGLTRLNGCKCDGAGNIKSVA